MGNPLRPDQIDPLKGIQPAQNIEEGAKGNFAEMMQPSTARATPSGAPSPMDILPGTNPVSGPSYDTMQTQLAMAQSHIADMQAQAQTPGLRIKPQDNAQLIKHMEQATDNLKTVNGKLGIEPRPPMTPPEGPLGKFMGLINGGSSDIADAKQQIATMSASPDTLNPAQMLEMQLKVNRAQQQIEFASIILSKAVDGFKQLMNLQI